MKYLVISFYVVLVILLIMLFKVLFYFNHKYSAISGHKDTIVLLSDDKYEVGDKVYYRAQDFQENIICTRKTYGMDDSCIIKSVLR